MYKLINYYYNKKILRDKVNLIADHNFLKIKSINNLITIKKLTDKNNKFVVKRYYEQNLNLRLITEIKDFLNKFHLKPKDNVIHSIIIPPHHELEWHVDYDRLCSINVPLTDNCVIELKEDSIQYDVPILINSSSCSHRVFNNTLEDRQILSISFYQPFNDIYKLVDSK